MPTTPTRTNRPLPRQSARGSAAGRCGPAISRHTVVPCPPSFRSGSSPGAQRGVALLVALILLVVITLVGLAAIGTTILQNKATANQYDRQISFQGAEAAMRVAASLIQTSPGLISRNCQTSATVCQANPFEDVNLPTGSIQTVTSGQFTASANAPMQPQYVIESLGNWTNPSNDVGFGNTANSRNYGVQGKTSTAIYYRITARSCDPASTACKHRAVVTLQSVVKQG